MIKTSSSALMILSLVAFSVPESAIAGSVRNRAAPRHMSLRASVPVAAMIVPLAPIGFDLGTQTAIRIQDGHHGEGFN